MKFHKKYDKSLDLILCNNSNSKDMIVNFINNIPSRLYDKMCMSIIYSFNSFSSYEFSDISQYDEILLSGECRTSGDMLYWYMINPQTHALNLGECVVDGNEQYDVFQMTLYPSDDFQIYRMKNFDKKLIGEISYGYIDQGVLCQVNDCITDEFNLVKYPFVDYVVCSSSDANRKKHYDLINIKNHLDFQTIFNKKCFTRKRKKI